RARGAAPAPHGVHRWREAGPSPPAATVDRLPHSPPTTAAERPETPLGRVCPCGPAGRRRPCTKARPAVVAHRPPGASALGGRVRDAEQVSTATEPTTINVARVYDYLLEGTNIYAVDRAGADQIKPLFPELEDSARC